MREIQSRKEEKSLIGIVARARGFFSRPKVKWVSIFVGVISYLFLYQILVKLSVKDDFVFVVLGREVRSTMAQAIISQVLLLFVITMVVIHSRLGFIIDLCLQSFCIIGAVISTFLLHNPSSVDGIITFVCELLVVNILYSYVRYAETKLLETNQQREEMLSLYEEIAVSEERLVKQNHQLEVYNTALKDREEELNQLAFYDPLTGLANRRKLMDCLEEIQKEAQVTKKRFAIVFADLDNFKKINDSAGHHVGDEVLQQIARQWVRIVNPNDLLVRLGGDEFALLITRDLTSSEIFDYVSSLRDSLSNHSYHQPKEFQLKASFGISIYPVDGENTNLLLKAADMAMYEAKSKHRNEIQFFNESIQNRFMSDITMELNLQQALAKGEFYLQYQAQYDSKGHTLRGFETLVRWNSPVLGRVSPMQFIPIAEETGEIIKIGAWILQESLRTAQSWMEQSQKSFILSVNISVIQLLDADFINMVTTALNQSGFPAQCLELEVTESSLISSMDTAVAVMNQLRCMGIRIALDDFGTGYASLSYLQRLPIDLMKIDKSFIDSVAEHERGRALVTALINVGHELGYRVIAEGVEHEEQLEILKDIGCDHIQGYLWAKPEDKEIAATRLQ